MLFFVGLVMVFLLGLQQQHVTHGKHGWSVATSYLLAFAQVTLIQEAVASDWVGVLLLGTGGAIGASASMVVHRKFIAG